MEREADGGAAWGDKSVQPESNCTMGGGYEKSAHPVHRHISSIPFELRSEGEIVRANERKRMSAAERASEASSAERANE